MFEDLGLTEYEIQSAIENGEYDFGEERGLYVKIKSSDEEVRVKESLRFQENNDLREVNERIEFGRVKYYELSKQLTDIVEIKRGNDITYNDFRKIVLLGNSTEYICSKEEFDGYDSLKKETILKEIITDMVLERTHETLN